MAKKVKKELTASEIMVNKTEGWIATHKNVIIAAVAVAVVAIIAAVVITLVTNKSASSSDKALASLESSYEEYQLMDADEEGYEEKLASVKSDAEALVSDSGLKKYSGAKAELILAEIDYSDGEYAEAAEKYASVYNAQKNTYLGQVALMSEAAALESSGDADGALALYNQVFDEYGTDGIYASRALFNAARLTESSDKALAISIYEQLVGEFEESESEYAKLAKSRVSQLKASN